MLQLFIHSLNKLTKAQFGIFLQGHTDYLSLRWGSGWSIYCKVYILHK